MWSVAVWKPLWTLDECFCGIKKQKWKVNEELTWLFKNISLCVSHQKHQHLLQHACVSSLLFYTLCAFYRFITRSFSIRFMLCFQIVTVTGRSWTDVSVQEFTRQLCVQSQGESGLQSVSWSEVFSWGSWCLCVSGRTRSVPSRLCWPLQLCWFWGFYWPSQ